MRDAIDGIRNIMSIGDGSDFGGGGGDGPYVVPFRRFDLFHPEYNRERTVFPHGLTRGSIANEIERVAKRIGLERVFVWDGPENEVVVSAILLRADPWNVRAGPEPPAGYYEGATGTTAYGATCWRRRKQHGGQLHISYVTWRFFEAADYATSIAVRVVPRLYAPAAETAQFSKTADQIVAKMADWLGSHPPGPAAELLRQRVRG